jgi:microcystin-dependent protein
MSSDLPIGTILIYSLTGAPDGYLLCNGTSYSRTTYSSLYSVIGTTYGSDDSSTFKVPDFTSRFPIGKTTSQSLGQKTQGSTSVSISKDNLPSHNHTLDISLSHTHKITYNNNQSSVQNGYQFLSSINESQGSSDNNTVQSYSNQQEQGLGTTSGITLTSNSNTISISEQLDSSGNSISLDVKNRQMNLNYIIKYA